jgi:hypothetical protein
MKLAFAIQRKIRLAIALAILMFFSIIFSLIESYNINKIAKSFNSIYEDRLIPAVDLYTIANQIQNKRQQLFSFLFRDNVSQQAVTKYLKATDAKLDTLINKYENTFLVKTETNYLAHLKKNLQDFRKEEQALIITSLTDKEKAKSIYLNRTIFVYDELNKDLMQLTQVQTQVGKELMAESKKSQASSSFITKLQLFIAIILGLVIMILILTDKQVLLKREKFNLN